MRGVKYAKRIGNIFLLFVVFSLIAGAVLGQPIGLAYVETGSMEPVLDPGDGYIAVPTAVTGPIEKGDVVVFDAQNINDGGLVTHRIIGKTEAGYITKGDANPVSDQSGAEPPVDRTQIKAKALMVAGNVVVIPELGTAVIAANGAVSTIQRRLAVTFGTRAILGAQGIAYLLVGFGIITYGLSALFESSTQDRSRRVKRETGILTPRTAIVSMTVLLIIILTAGMLLPAGVHQFQYISSESDSAGPNVIRQGTAENLTFQVPSNGPLPVVTILEPDGSKISISKSLVYVPSGETKSISVRLRAPEATGQYSSSLKEHRYLAFLPIPLIKILYQIHPWLPIIVINVMVGMLFIVISTLIIGFDPLRIGRRQTNVSLRVRLQRWFR